MPFPSFPTTGLKPYGANLQAYIDAGAITNLPVSLAAAPAGGTTDDLSALQATLNAVGSNGGVVFLRAGTYLVSNTLTIPNKVTVRGAGRSATTIKAHSSFPTTGVPLVALGPTGLAFESRLERCTVDANGVTGSQGVYSYAGQEMCGLAEVVVQGFKDYGVFMDSLTANYMLDNVEVYPASTGANNGIILKAGVGSQVVRKATVGVGGLLTVGISVPTGEATIIGAHCENCTDGILFDVAYGTVIGASGPSAASNVTNLVRGTGNTRYLTLVNLLKNGATNAYKADLFGITNTDGHIELAVVGNGHIARLQHTGDQAGFYGKTPVSRGAALTAATAAAPAGGTGTAAGGWDTAAHRDTAIAAINNLQTRVADLEARLNTTSGVGLISG